MLREVPKMDALESGDQSPDLYDLLIIGGGINGVSIARDAAGRGLSVLLVEKDDLASHTSSASSKLIHGGLRYLEYGEFRLVREALIERERLLSMAPHIIWPLSFALPMIDSPRPAWMVRLGLFIYDHLGGRKKLPATKTIPKLSNHPVGNGLKNNAAKAFMYSDCWVEDSRLVVLNAMDAKSLGATIRTHTQFVTAERSGDGWAATLEDKTGQSDVKARIIVNAAGSWVEDVLRTSTNTESTSGVRLIKGSHIVVPKLFDGDHAFILQNKDKRVIFAIPYEQHYTLVGTTDIPWEGAPAAPTISDEETNYLLETIEQFFERKTNIADIKWSYSGIRPLYDDKAANASAVTRDYVLDLDNPDKSAPILSIFGGKITTSRKLAEHAMQMLSPLLVVKDAPWSSTRPLPGGDIEGRDFDHFIASLSPRYPALPATLLRRYARAYGTRVHVLLNGISKLEDLGTDFGDNLYKAEVDYLVAHEWAETADDILYRRSKLGLHIQPATRIQLDDYLVSKESHNGLASSHKVTKF